MKLPEMIDSVELCKDLAELRQAMQKITEHYGFASFAYIDNNAAKEDELLVIATTDDQWGEDYRRNHFVSFDPVLSTARRSNTPFSWGETRYPLKIGRKKSGALRTMEAAFEHGFTEGLAIPFHSVDVIGGLTTAVCGFFWRDTRLVFRRFIQRRTRDELHLILIYWSQTVRKVVRDRGLVPGAIVASLPQVSDRERTILTLAARGLTVLESADALSISGETVQFHLRNAMRKLTSTNKTQAAVLALKLGLIDL